MKTASDLELEQADAVVAGLAGVFAPGVICLAGDHKGFKRGICFEEEIVTLYGPADGRKDVWIVVGELGYGWRCHECYLRPIGFDAKFAPTEVLTVSRNVSRYADKTLQKQWLAKKRAEGRDV